MSKKLTYNYIKKQIEKTGYKLLSKEYRNNHTKLEVQCSEGHIYKVIWINFQQGSRCSMCSNKTCADKRKLSYDYVKKEIEQKGCKLLSKGYKGAHTKLEVRCPKKHVYKVTWSNFQQGSNCPICNNNRRKLDYDYVKTFIESEGYKLLNREYKNKRARLKIQCPKKHIYKVKWNSFQQGQRCPICANEIRDNKKRLTYDYVKSFIESKKYKLLSKDYKGAYVKLKLRCPKKHEFEIIWASFQQGQKCPICQAHSFASKAEREIANIIEVQSIKIKRNDRTQIINPLTGNKLELDIFMPDLNKAIEYNGIYWHSFRNKIIKDKIKLQECAKKGIKLLVIKEQNWIDNKINCINKIKSFVGDNIIK